MTTLALAYLAMLGLSVVALGTMLDSHRYVRRAVLAAGCIGVVLALAALLGGGGA